jgi:hypothetical protein
MIDLKISLSPDRMAALDRLAATNTQENSTMAIAKVEAAFALAKIEAEARKQASMAAAAV